MFFAPLQEKGIDFFHFRFYVGVLRRLRDVSEILGLFWIFSDFFGFFSNLTFCHLWFLLPRML